MNYRKAIAKIFAQQSSNTGTVAVAVVAGLAAGAVISILFAPSKGSDTRKMITDGANGLGTGIRDQYNSLVSKITGQVEEIEEPVAAEVPHFIHTTPKRRKSDIKDLVDEAHHLHSNEAHS